jgi:hypothetical protein
MMTRMMIRPAQVSFFFCFITQLLALSSYFTCACGCACVHAWAHTCMQQYSALRHLAEPHTTLFCVPPLPTAPYPTSIEVVRALYTRQTEQDDEAALDVLIRAHDSGQCASASFDGTQYYVEVDGTQYATAITPQLLNFLTAVDAAFVSCTPYGAAVPQVTNYPALLDYFTQAYTTITDPQVFWVTAAREITDYGPANADLACIFDLWQATMVPSC